MPELAQGRFFDYYGASMDAALEEKVKDIEPWLVPGLVVDKGCGTGSFMKYLAARGRKVVGVELSDELAKAMPGVIQANVTASVFAEGFVDNIVLSSVMHEVYSYNDYSLHAVEQCLRNCVKELKAGGRIIIRDIWAPEIDEQRYTFLMDSKTWESFLDFRKKLPADIVTWIVDAKARKVEMDTRTAVEFLSKKDYDKHWELELKEVYTSVPLSFYKSQALTLGLKVLQLEPRANEWIRRHRWFNGVFGQLPPYTNQLIVFEK